MTRAKEHADEQERFLQALEIQMALRTDSNVLITGESGTGKSTFAQRAHLLSPRKDGPFIPLNLTSVHEGTAESEFFGHERGAFTGALYKRVGKLEAAHGGTLFLDEVGEMSPQLQCKLLEFLQTRMVTPIGSNHAKKVNVRVIAATHRNLRQLVREGKFRQDLFYRLNVVSVRMDPLRDVPQEILDHASHTLRILSEEIPSAPSASQKELSLTVKRLFLDYSWPGNMREMRNVLEFAFHASGAANTIDVRHLPSSFLGEFTQQGDAQLLPHRRIEQSSHLNRSFPVVTYCKDSLRDAESRFFSAFVQSALHRNQGNIPKTAKVLGIHPTTLHRRLKAQGCSPIQPTETGKN